jgi:flavodoxin I
MAKIGLFYGSNEGHTEYVADRIKQAFDEIDPNLVTIFNIAKATVDDIAQWEYLIFGIPTWNVGQLQDDWDIFLPDMDKLDLSGKKVALFGLGDQYIYPETFLDAMGILGEKVRDQGGERVGYWPIDGYQFTDSLAQEGDHFIGLAIDEEQEPELTDERIQAWVQQLVQEFGLDVPQAVQALSH